MTITTNINRLTPAQARQAQYLSALAELNAARSKFIDDATATGQATMPDDALYAQVRELEPDWRESATALSEAERRTGIGRRLLTYYCQHSREMADSHGVEVRCEKRAEWYLCAEDVIALRSAMQD